MANPGMLIPGIVTVVAGVEIPGNTTGGVVISEICGQLGATSAAAHGEGMAKPHEGMTGGGAAHGCSTGGGAAHGCSTGGGAAHGRAVGCSMGGGAAHGEAAGCSTAMGCVIPQYPGAVGCAWPIGAACCSSSPLSAADAEAVTPRAAMAVKQATK
jgi:hypothetical protein